MDKFYIWIYIIGAVGIAVTANTLAAIWAGQENKWWSLWLLAIIVISPLVFIAFGLVAEKVGLSVGAGTLDSLLVLGTILVGLIFFGEWGTLSVYQNIGLVSTVLGIILLQIHK